MSGLDVDTRSDIYSLGVLLYELLTGKTPFDGKELVKSGLDEMRRTLREKEPQRPSTILTTLHGTELKATAEHRHAEPPKLISLLRGDLDWIVMKALEKDRTRRYESLPGGMRQLARLIRPAQHRGATILGIFGPGNAVGESESSNVSGDRRGSDSLSGGMRQLARLICRLS